MAALAIFSAAARYFSMSDGRKREHVGDVVEAVAGIVDGEIGGGLEGDGEEIAHGGVVFVTA